MRILRRFWRPAAVMMSAGVMLFGSGAVAQAGTTTVKPRHECGGFNGNVEWSVTNPIKHSGQIHIWGELWDTCKADNMWLYVSYNLVPGGSYQFFPIATTYPKGISTVGVNWYNSKTNMNFSGIKVRICSTNDGTDCGTAIGV